MAFWIGAQRHRAKPSTTPRSAGLRVVLAGGMPAANGPVDVTVPSEIAQHRVPFVGENQPALRVDRAEFANCYWQAPLVNQYPMDACVAHKSRPNACLVWPRIGPSAPAHEPPLPPLPSLPSHGLYCGS